MKYLIAIGVTLVIIFVTHNLFASALGFITLLFLTAKENETTNTSEENSENNNEKSE